jgi:hypothetical protein
MELDREKVRVIRKDIEAALLEVATKHGLESKPFSVQFTPNSIKARIEMTAVLMGTGGVNLASKEALNYERVGKHYGLEPNRLGVVFRYNGNDYRFLGLTASRPKYPIDAMDIRSGKRFKMPAATAVNAINDCKPI